MTSSKASSFCVACFLAISCIYLDSVHAQNLGVFKPPQSGERRQGFVQGDAFFSISEESLAKAEIETNSDNPDLSHLVVPYNFPRITGGPISGGMNHFGFKAIKIVGMTQDAEELLNVLLAAIRHETIENEMDDPRRLTADTLLKTGRLNSRICIVNRNFQLGVHSLFIRYNEDWNREPTKIERDRIQSSKTFDLGTPLLGFGEYQPFIFNSEALIEDWRNAAKVEPLHCTVPEVLTLGKTEGSPFSIVEPITVNFSDVAIVAVPGEFDDTRIPNSLNSVMIVLRDGAVTRFRWVVDQTGKVLVKDSISYEK